MFMIDDIESIFSQKILSSSKDEDPSHDILHLQRVVDTAKRLCAFENAKLEVVIPAAWLHDFVIIPKSDPRRSQASRLSAVAAVEFLNSINYPREYLQEISHAIEAHSFSANINAETIEARVVQDADRLDGLGAIGIARCFATAGLLRRSFYHFDDPFCQGRAVDDSQFTIDHFYAKLFKVAESLQTKAGREEGLRRVQFMKKYLAELQREIGSADEVAFEKISDPTV